MRRYGVPRGVTERRWCAERTLLALVGLGDVAAFVAFHAVFFASHTDENSTPWYIRKKDILGKAMTLTLHLSPEVEARLRAVAQEQGLDPVDVAEHLLQTYLPAATREPPTNGMTTPQRDPAFVALVKSIRGKFARTATDLATEALHRERQADKEREEQRIRGTKA